MDYQTDWEFNQWLKKNYACCKCEKELFSFFGEQITTKFFVREHHSVTINDGTGFYNKTPKDKGKYCDNCKEKLEKQEKNWTYNLTNLTKPIKERFSIFHQEKLRKTPIPTADQEKVIEFYKQKYCSSELKCSECGDFSVTLGEDEDGFQKIFDESYDDENNIYCAEHIKGKNQTGSMYSSSYLYDVREEWKKESKKNKIMILSLETLNYLQKEQKKLDIFIHQQNGLEMKDTFYLRKIALLVEIGEVANELKSFKYWKKDKDVSLEKVQEELIDCLHFFLSLVNCSQINFNEYFSPKIEKKLDTNKILLTIFKETGRLVWLKEEKKRENEKFYYRYYRWLSIFEKLCRQIDFDEEKLLEVYNHKNKINQERQLLQRAKLTSL